MKPRPPSCIQKPVLFHKRRPLTDQGFNSVVIGKGFNICQICINQAGGVAGPQPPALKQSGLFCCIFKLVIPDGRFEPLDDFFFLFFFPPTLVMFYDEDIYIYSRTSELRTPEL